jgi:hypothetical protein
VTSSAVRILAEAHSGTSNAIKAACDLTMGVVSASEPASRANEFLADPEIVGAAARVNAEMAKAAGLDAVLGTAPKADDDEDEDDKTKMPGTCAK